MQIAQKPDSRGGRGGPGLLGVVALVAAVCALLPASVQAAPVPWGAGCMPVPEGGTRTSSNCGAELVEGEAVAPTYAPTSVKRVIAAANEIVHRPYVWGGGHLSFQSRGYDCSGAVGYALHGASLLDTTMVSGQLASWGAAGRGRWITIYANVDHVYMVVAGLRFDTRSNPPGTSGPRWHMSWAEPKRFVARHPLGL